MGPLVKAVDMSLVEKVKNMIDSLEFTNVIIKSSINEDFDNKRELENFRNYILMYKKLNYVSRETLEEIDNIIIKNDESINSKIINSKLKRDINIDKIEKLYDIHNDYVLESEVK